MVGVVVVVAKYDVLVVDDGKPTSSGQRSVCIVVEWCRGSTSLSPQLVLRLVPRYCEATALGCWRAECRGDRLWSCRRSDTCPVTVCLSTIRVDRVYATVNLIKILQDWASLGTHVHVDVDDVVIKIKVVRRGIHYPLVLATSIRYHGICTCLYDTCVYSTADLNACNI